jgi:hypothetical protein
VDWILSLAQNIFLIVHDYLNTLRKVTPFRNNKPRRDWWKLFKKRHPELTEKLAENMYRSRMQVTEESVCEYFHFIKESVKDVPPDNIINYEKTNFRENPGAELVCE